MEETHVIEDAEKLRWRKEEAFQDRRGSDHRLRHSPLCWGQNDSTQGTYLGTFRSAPETFVAFANFIIQMIIQ